MPYIGNPIYQSAFVTDQFNGDGSTVAFTMSVAPAGVSNVLVAVSGVLQDPSTYGVAGNTITFSTAPPSGTGNISVRYLGVPVTGIVTTAYRTVTEFTATASQTTFTPPSYTVGFINVYLNGVLLGSADYTATNGTTVVLATGASAGNLVTVESFRVETVLNAISNTAGSVSSSNIQTSVSLTTPTMTSPTISSGALTIGTTSLGQGNASSFKNRIINGAMVINQRAYNATPAGSTYTLDRWVYQPTPASKFSISQSSSAPAGFNNSLLLTVVSAYSPTGTDSINIGQYIEGFNVADLNWGTANAKTVTLSFWVNCSVTGTYSVQFGGDNGRGYIGTYTVNSANTWEQKSITVPGDTSGTYGTTNGTGITVFFALGAGSGRQNTANTWIASGYTTTAATGSTNLVATNGATLYLTGVQLEVGSSATSFDTRSYGTELALCQRYALVLGGSSFENIGLGVVTSSTNVNMPIILPVDMRASPSVSFSGTIYMNTSGLQTVTAMATNNASVRMPNFTITSSGMTTGTFLLLSANGKMTLSAEL